MQGMRRVVAARLRKRVFGTVLRDNTEHVHLLGVTTETQQLCDEIAARRCQYVDQPYASTMLRRLLHAEWCPFGCRTRQDGWRVIHASAGARTARCDQPSSRSFPSDAPTRSATR